VVKSNLKNKKSKTHLKDEKLKSLLPLLGESPSLIREGMTPEN
jgi:hypothetical protein